MSINVRFLIILLTVASIASAFVTRSTHPFGRTTARYSRNLSRFAVRDRVTMMPASLEREPVRTGGPAVLERPVTERKERVEDPTKQRKRMGNEAWEVRIYNDGLNTREHVARSLVQVTGMSEINAYQTMMQAHQNGIAVVGRWVYEVAEMYHDALRKNGIICDIVPVDEEY